jgi:predicted deacylase
MQPQSVANGVRGIKNYLATKGMLQIPGFPLPETAAHSMTFHPKNQGFRKYYAPAGGVVQNLVELGTVVQAGQVVYELLSFNKEGTLPETIAQPARDSGLVFDVTTNHAANQGEYLLSVLANIGEKKLIKAWNFHSLAKFPRPYSSGE